MSTEIGTDIMGLVVLEMTKEAGAVTQRRYEGRVTDVKTDNNGRPYAIQLTTNGRNAVWFNVDHIEKWWVPTTSR